MMMSRHVLKEEYDDDEQTRPEKRTEEEHVIEKPAGATPTYAEAYNNLGILYRDAAMLGVYVWEYMHCLKIDPDSRNAGQNFGYCCFLALMLLLWSYWHFLF